MNMGTSKFKKIQVSSVKEQFKEELVNMILSGKLSPGEPLPTERQLAADMGISKTVVHEGIRDLVQMGFLDNLSHRGVIVTDYALTGNIETLITVLNYHQGRVDMRTALGVVDFCTWVECPSLERVAAHHTDKDIKALEDLVMLTKRRSLVSVESMGEAWASFHREVVFLSGNPLLPLLYSSMMQIGLPVFNEWCWFVGPEPILNCIQLITDDLKAGDGPAAVLHFQASAAKFRTFIKTHKEKFREDTWSPE